MAIIGTLFTLCIGMGVSDTFGVKNVQSACFLLGFDQFKDDPAFQIKVFENDPWDLKSIDNDSEWQTKTESEYSRIKQISSKADNKVFSNSPMDAYDIRWTDNFSKSDAFPLARTSRKRKFNKSERGFASIKPSPLKRMKNDLPKIGTAIGKENVPHSLMNQPNEKSLSNRTPVSSKVYQYKGINEINLLINGESIELHCGMPVFLPDFRESVELNLHLSRDRDALGCLKFNRKPTPANVDNILAMVKSKMHCSHFEIRDGSVHDDAVVFERVKQVALALAGSGMDTFMHRVFYQKPSEYLNNGVARDRDYLENWHYRYFTRHMWFEIQLLEVLRKYYPRHGAHNGFVSNTSLQENTPDHDALSDDFNITKQHDSVLPRSDFQQALLDVLEKHLKELPHPTRLSKKLDDHTNPLESVIAQSMYSHTRYMDETNINELFALAQQSLRKGFSRLQALHIVLHLAFRYSLHSRYLVFMEHDGAIAMSTAERNGFIGNFEEIQGMLNAENKFTNTVPRMFREMMNFIERSGCYQNNIKSTVRDPRL